MRRFLRIATLALWLPVLSGCHFIELVSFFETADTLSARTWELQGGMILRTPKDDIKQKPLIQASVRYGLLPRLEVGLRAVSLVDNSWQGHAVLGELKGALFPKPYGIIPAIGLKVSVGRLKPPGGGWETVFGGSLHLSYPIGPHTLYLAGRHMRSQTTQEGNLHGAVGLRFDFSASQRWWIELSSTNTVLGPSATLLGVAWSLRF